MNDKQLAELKRIKSILSAVTGLEDDDQEYIEDARKALQSIISQDALDKMAENAREIGLSYEQQPTGKQSLQVASSIVDAYCAAWEQSFLADNPFDTVHLTDSLKKHVEAGLKAALAKATGETK
jgi:hypothetical protein